MRIVEPDEWDRQAEESRAEAKPGGERKKKPARRRRGKKARRRRVADALLWVVLVAGVVCGCVGGWMVAQDGKAVEGYVELAETAGPSEEAGEDGDPGIDWAALREINQDVCGWVSVDGTSISLPVVHASSDWPDKYLNYTFDGERSFMGCPYLNYACDPNGRVMTVYGHHVWYSGKMFNELGNAYESSKFSQLGGAWWTTPEFGGKRFQLVGSALVSKWSGDEWNMTSFDTAEDVREWLGRILPDLSQRTEDAEELSQSATRVLVLVTCTETGIKSKRSVTVFADPDPQLADHTQDISFSAAACKALAGDAAALGEAVSSLGEAEAAGAQGGGWTVTATDRQLQRLTAAAQKNRDGKLSALLSAYPECDAAIQDDGTLSVYIPECDEGNWDGIKKAAEECAGASGLAEMFGSAGKGAAWNTRVVFWNKGAGKSGRGGTIADGAAFTWTADDWAKSR